MVSDEYAAGFFDGEGCVNITVRGKFRQVSLRVMIVNTDEWILKELQLQYGGNLMTPRKLKQGWKPTRQLSLTGKVAIDFLHKIYPFLRIKRRQAELAFEFWGFMQKPRTERCEAVVIPVENFKRRVVMRRTDETKSLELLYKDQMHALNLKGS
jgi:hypothetical protein